MTRLAKWVERVWHGPRTRKYDASHHQPYPTTHAAVVARKAPR